MNARLSATGKRWSLIDRTETDLMRHLLSVRAVADVDRFLQPVFDEHLHDGGQLLGMTEAVRLLSTAVRDGVPIGIFADYDVDGTTGAALVYEMLSYLGVPVLIYIPTRAQGYGLSRAGVEHLVKAGARLILTIDLGSSAGPVVKELRRAGMALPLIITDHHEVDRAKFPTEAIVVNPNQPDCPYPFKQLSGATVAWKVMEQLLRVLSEASDHRISARTADGLLKWSLDLVALSTVCDLVPLIDENRVLVHFGLKVMAKQRRLGLQALAKVARVELRSPSTTTLGFQIGPRLNVAVRMGQPPYPSSEFGPQVTMPFVLLVGRNPAELDQIGEELEGLNRARRTLTTDVVQEAVAGINEADLAEKSALVVTAPTWPAGIIGLAAGKLVERYQRPTVVLTESTPGVLTGSLRSVPGFPIHEILRVLAPHLLSGGGHAMAGGVTLNKGQLAAFTEGFERLAGEMIDPVDLVPHLAIEAGVKLANLDPLLLDQLQQFAPFGMANPRPTFLVEGVRLDDVRTIGTTRAHLKARVGRLARPSSSWDVIGFGLAPFVDLASAPIDLACQLGWNEWRGQRTHQLEVCDLRTHQ